MSAGRPLALGLALPPENARWVYADGRRLVSAWCAWSAAWACHERATRHRAAGRHVDAYAALERAGYYAGLFRRLVAAVHIGDATGNPDTESGT